jgi:hypothetical protein
VKGTLAGSPAAWYVLAKVGPGRNGAPCVGFGNPARTTRVPFAMIDLASARRRDVGLDSHGAATLSREGIDDKSHFDGSPEGH